MTFESVDALQKTLADKVFHYTADRKKAAGRALGTLVEIVTFYTVRAWGLRDNVVIERSVPEFANPEITHNVEFSLHPIIDREVIVFDPLSLPLTAKKIKRRLPYLSETTVKSTQVLSSDGVKRNATVLVELEAGPVVANVDELTRTRCGLTVCKLASHPFAIFECKRVGVEEGMRKGPQTIEKAKQGAYVARSVSSLQKLRLRSGHLQGVMEQVDGTLRTGNYEELIREIVDTSALELRGFILTVGVVSNHGNWFTSDNHNKELRVLAQSYDWLLFLTDAGLAQFIERLLLNPRPELRPARDAFLSSYSGSSGRNRFTKVRISTAADKTLRTYFESHESEVESWFNVISPNGGTLETLRTDLEKLAAKTGIVDKRT